MTDYELYRFILRELPDLNEMTVLDCGCARGVWGYLLRSEKNGYKTTIIGLDRYNPYLSFCKTFHVYNNLVKADIRHLPFRDSAFEIVIAIEVLEHLEKTDGTKFLSELERVCKRKLVLSTPNGFWKQGALGGNNLELHRSGWTVNELKNLGFRVHGIGFKFVKVYDVDPRVWGFFFYIFTPFSYVIPTLAHHLVASKEKIVLAEK
ncbi:MAG: class I SAM-dependent methyltransferase [Candidatus Bathyarchaeia archaeon]|jgi:ubiquinone/menaquinone biosynthesis C-methylase UbiE